MSYIFGLVKVINLNEITKLIWYNSNESYIEIDYLKEIRVDMKKKHMKSMGWELGIPMEVRKKR